MSCSDDDDRGLVVISWRMSSSHTLSPSPIEQLVALLSASVLMIVIRILGPQ